MDPFMLMVQFKDLPDVPVIHPGLSAFIRSTAIFIYLCLFACIAHNIYKYVVIKERYKEFSIVLFYAFAVILVGARITEYSLYFTTILMNHVIQTFLIMADGCAIAIGLSQVTLVCDIIITLQLFKEQLDLSDCETISAVKSENNRIEKKADRLVCVLHMAIIFVVALFVFEMVARLCKLEHAYPLIIFAVEMFLCNVALLLATLKFL